MDLELFVALEALKAAYDELVYAIKDVNQWLVHNDAFEKIVETPEARDRLKRIMTGKNSKLAQRQADVIGAVKAVVMVLKKTETDSGK